MKIYIFFIAVFVAVSLYFKCHSYPFGKGPTPVTEIRKFIAALPKISKSNCQEAFEIMNQSLEYDMEESKSLGTYSSSFKEENTTYTLLAAPLSHNSPTTEFSISLIILPNNSNQALDSILKNILGSPSDTASKNNGTWEIPEVGTITAKGLNIVNFQTNASCCNPPKSDTLGKK